ncbi:putative glycine dehydrogenase (decarboxylating) subunit 2, partial [Frankliniella fusca]
RLRSPGHPPTLLHLCQRGFEALDIPTSTSLTSTRIITMPKRPISLSLEGFKKRQKKTKLARDPPPAPEIIEGDILQHIVKELGLDMNDLDQACAEICNSTESATGQENAQCYVQEQPSEQQQQTDAAPAELNAPDIIPITEDANDAEEENYVEPPEGMHVRPRECQWRDWHLTDSLGKHMRAGLDLRTLEPYFFFYGWEV